MLSPTFGIDLYAEYINITQNGEFSARIKHENKTDNILFGVYKESYQKNSYSCRLEWRSKTYGNSFQIRLRNEIGVLSNGVYNLKEYGYLNFIEFHFFDKNTFSSAIRIAQFNAESYDVSRWAYENNVPGLLTTEVHQGRGQRIFAVCNWKYSDKVSLHGKISATFRDDVKQIGTGWDQLPKNRDVRGNLQCELKL